MMNKPEKKVDSTSDEQYLQNTGYNQDCDEWEKWLPNSKELKDTIYGITEYSSMPQKELMIINNKLLKAIAKRIGKK